jgi:hypothetical protein
LRGAAEVTEGPAKGYDQTESANRWPSASRISTYSNEVEFVEFHLQFRALIHVIYSKYYLEIKQIHKNGIKALNGK